MSVPYFTPSDDEGSQSLWDLFWLGGVTWPGVWEVSVKKARDVEKTKQKGKDGSKSNDNGYKGAEIKATGRIFKEADFRDLEGMLPFFDPKSPGVTRTPLDAYHPVLALLGVDSVYIDAIEISPPRAGVLTVTLTISEYFPETKETSNKKEVQGFDGATTGGNLNASDFEVGSVSKGPPNL